MSRGHPKSDSRSEHQKKHWEQGDHDHEMVKRKEILAKWRKKHNNVTK